MLVKENGAPYIYIHLINKKQHNINRCPCTPIPVMYPLRTADIYVCWHVGQALHVGLLLWAPFARTCLTPTGKTGENHVLRPNMAPASGAP